MPFWGLVATSAGFFIPCFIALRRRNKRHSVMSGTLAVTSLFYHGTLHPIAHRIDLLYAHSVGIIHLAEALAAPCFSRLLMIGTPMYLYFAKSTRTEGHESCLWHMAVHISSVIAWSIEIAGSVSALKELTA